MGVVRNPRTVSALAPVYTVVITTEELSILGYCWTGSPLSERQPTRRMTRLTTIARTGCLMKMSVKDRTGFSWTSVEPGRGGDRGGLALHRLAQLEGPRGRDLLARREPLEDQSRVAHHRSAGHRSLVGPRRPGIVRGDHPDVVSARALSKRAHWH